MSPNSGTASCPLHLAGPHESWLDAWMMNSPGLKIIVPATPADAKDCCWPASVMRTRPYLHNAILVQAVMLDKDNIIAVIRKAWEG